MPILLTFLSTFMFLYRVWPAYTDKVQGAESSTPHPEAFQWSSLGPGGLPLTLWCWADSLPAVISTALPSTESAPWCPKEASGARMLIPRASGALVHHSQRQPWSWVSLSPLGRDPPRPSSWASSARPKERWRASISTWSGTPGFWLAKRSVRRPKAFWPVLDNNGAVPAKAHFLCLLPATGPATLSLHLQAMVVIISWIVIR